MYVFVIVFFQKRAELAARRAKFDSMFEEKEEETESRTYDLSKHLVTVTEVAEVDLEDEGTHLGPNQAGGSGRREGRFSSGEWNQLAEQLTSFTS